MEERREQILNQEPQELQANISVVVLAVSAWSGTQLPADNLGGEG
jgi:hypothetical protein